MTDTSPHRVAPAAAKVPFTLIAFVFVILEAMTWGAGRPGMGFAIIALGFLIAIIIDFRAWVRENLHDRHHAEVSFTSLRERLEQAEAERIERLRYS